jgi:hypothetical protein
MLKHSLSNKFLKSDPLIRETRVRKEITSMKTPMLINSLWIHLFLSIFLLTSSSFLFAAQLEEEVSTQEYLFVKGIVHSVSLQEQSVTVKALKGPQIKILLEQQTELDGFKKVVDLQPNEKVKIWYRPTPYGNVGLKILRLPELGC